MKKNFLHTFFLCLLSAFTLNCLAKGDIPTNNIYYVDAAKADNSGNGLSWATAKKDIQAALDLAIPADEVWVKAGTYFPTIIPAGLTATGPNSPVSSRDKTLLLKDGVKLYGGFAGTETMLIQRIPGSNKTIIDGDIGTPGDSTDNCYHLMVYLGSYSTAGVTIDGFSMRNGTAGTWGGSVPPYDAASLTVGGIPYSIVRTYGGGIYMQQGQNNFVNNVVFEKNYAKNRGFGLWTDGGFGLTCNYTVTNCYFVHNYGIESSYGCWATNFGKNNGYNLVFYNNNILNFGFGAGVGIFLFDGLNKFVNCSFVSNNSIMGGVVNLANGAKSYFTNCLFYNNKQSPIYNPSNPGAPDFFDSEFAGSFGKFTNCSMSAPATFYTTTHYTMAAGSARNIFNQDPAFADINSVQGTDGKYYTADDGLALPATSPCKNAGENDSIPFGLIKDITGAGRLLGTAVDIGAYEIDAPVTCTPPAAPVTANQTFCDAASATVANLTASGSNIKWYAAATGGAPLTAATPLVDGTKYYASQTIGGCESTLRAVDSVTVFAAGAPAPTTANQTFCGGATVAGLVATGTNIKWYLAATGGTALPDTIALVDGTKYYASQTLGSCESPVRAVDSVTLNNIATVNAVADTTVCNGSNIAAINFSTTTVGGTVTYVWTNDNTNIGLAASGNGNIPGFTATNSFGGPITATVIVTPVITNGGISCQGVKDTFLITVNPTPNVNQPVNQSVCDGAATVPLNFTGGVPGTVYSWTNNTASVGLASSGTGNIASFTAINATNAVITASITVTPNYTNGGTTCSGQSKTFTITVNPTPTVAAVSNKAYCAGATTLAMPFNGTAGNAPGTQYSWANNNTGIGLAASGTGDIQPFVTTNATNGPLVATITVTPVGPTGCVGTPITFTITVNPTPIVNPVAGQILCNGSATAAINFNSATTGPTGALSFQWTNSAPSIGLAANGTGNIAAFTAVNTGLSPVTALITVTPVYTNGGITCTGASQTFTLVVNPTPTVNPVAAQTVCSGANTSVVIFTGSVQGTIYNWTNNNVSIGLAASGAGTISSFVATNTTNTAQTATITVTPNFSNGVTCAGAPITFTITVNPNPSVNPITSQAVCSGATVTQAFTGTVPGTVYNWTNNNPAIGLAASGTGNLNFVSVNTTGAPLSATVTVTSTYTNGGTTCTGAAQTFTITVNPVPTVNAVLPQILCNGSNTTAVTFTGAVAGTVYNWTNSNTSIGLAASGTGNITSFVATNTTAAVQTATITVTPTFTNGAITCTGTPITFTITVNPTPLVNTIANQTVCNGNNTTTVTIAGPVAGTVYSWTNDNTSIGLGASGTNIIPSFTAINTGITPLTATITVTPTFTNGGISCTGASTSFTITVNPTANVNQPASQLLCNGSNTTAITFTGTVAATTYSWTNSNTAIGLAASGTGNIPGFTATNNTTAPLTATIIVTPSTAGGCAGTSVAFTITVNPTPTVNAIANQAVCAGSTTMPVTISSPVANMVFTWTNDNPAIGLPGNGIGNIPSFITTNHTGTAITATITVTATYTNSGVTCTGPARTFTIKVNPLPNIVINVPARVCLTDTSLTLNATPADGTWSGWGVTGNKFSPSAAGLGISTVTYAVTNTAGCTAAANTGIVVNDCMERHNGLKNAVSLYSNPNNGRFQVKLLSDNYTSIHVRILDALGQQLKQYHFSGLFYGKVIPMDESSLPAGIYFLEASNGSERAAFRFLILH